MSEKKFLIDIVSLIHIYIQTQMNEIINIHQSISKIKQVKYEDWERIHQFLEQHIPLKIKTPELINQIEKKWKEGLIRFKRKN